MDTVGESHEWADTLTLKDLARLAPWKSKLENAVMRVSDHTSLP